MFIRGGGMTQEQKDIIKDRCQRNMFTFDDLDVNKRDVLSYVRELGYEYSYKTSNIDYKNIEWKGYKEIMRRGLQDNYSLSRVVRELREHTRSNFAERTFQYKLKETGIKEKEIRVEEWKYYLRMLNYEKEHGRKEMLKHFGLENVELDYTLYSISELAIGLNMKLDELYEIIREQDGMARYINSCKFTDYKTSLPYKDSDRFMNVVRGEEVDPFSRYLNSHS